MIKLRELRAKANMTQAELAEQLDLTQQAIGMYEQGRREPAYEILIRMADYFNVTTDELLGRNIISRSDSFGERLKAYRKANGLTQAELGERVHKSAQVISNLERGYTAGMAASDYQAITDVLGMGDNPKTITGNRLRKLRTDRGWTQEEVANQIGISRPAYVLYETGNNRPVRKLKELTALFGVTADYLMGIGEPAEPEQIELPTEPAPPTREDVIKAFANLLDVASEYLAGR